MSYFIPRLYTTGHTCSAQSDDGVLAAFASEIVNGTVSGLVSAAKNVSSEALSTAKERIIGNGAKEASRQAVSASQGIGTQWLKNLLGRSEWTLPCVDVKVVI